MLNVRLIIEKKCHDGETQKLERRKPPLSKFALRQRIMAAQWKAGESRASNGNDVPQDNERVYKWRRKLQCIVYKINWNNTGEEQMMIIDTNRPPV